MDPNQNRESDYSQSQAGAPQATIMPIGDEWAAGVRQSVVSPRSRRLRWGIAGAVVLSVTLVTAGGVFVLSGAAGAKSLTASVAPKNTVAFLEIRADLPGDQHAQLAGFLSHFPGFQDRAQFDTALDNMLNKLTGAVSPDLQYTSAFKPWMEGEVSFAAMAGGGQSTMGPPAAVAIFALKDRSAAQTWVSGELTRLGMPSLAQNYAGTTLYTTGSGIKEGAYAFTDQDLLLGTVAGVKAALDTKTNGSLADNANYQAAMNSISGDSLARFYVDPRTMVSEGLGAGSTFMGSMMGAGASPGAMMGLSAAALPAWVAGSVRAEQSQMVVNVAMPRPSGSGAGNHVSRLAPNLPGDTVGVFEVHSIGKLITDRLAALQSQLPASAASSLKTVTDALAQIGGLDWLGDGVAAVTGNGASYSGGLVAEATDASTASIKVALITNYATLASATLHITNRDETYKGVDIRVMSIPVGAGKPVEIAVAAKGNLILAGYTDAFIKEVIDTTPATALAAQPDYSAVIGAAGSSNDQSMYVNIPALEDQIGQAFITSNPTRWTQDYKPYFDHLGGVGYSVVDGDTVILRLVVTAK
jgi:hypothetical protein